MFLKILHLQKLRRKVNTYFLLVSVCLKADFIQGPTGQGVAFVPLDLTFITCNIGVTEVYRCDNPSQTPNPPNNTCSLEAEGWTNRAIPVCS